MKKSIYFIVLLIGIISCEKDIEIDIPYESPRIVVNSILDVGDKAYAEVSSSEYILEPNTSGLINNATLEVYQQGSPVASFDNTGSDLYELNHELNVGDQYKVVVKVPGMTSVEAITTIPDSVPIKSLTLDSTIVDGTPYYVLRIKIKDPVGSNYYNLLLQEIVSDISGTFIYETDYESHLDPVLEGLIWDENDGAYFSDNIFENKEYEFSIRFNKYTSHLFMGERSFSVTLFSVTKDHFEYDVARAKYYDSNDKPFSEPVQIPSNVKNGLGIIAGRSHSKKVIPAP